MPPRRKPRRAARAWASPRPSPRRSRARSRARRGSRRARRRPSASNSDRDTSTTRATYPRTRRNFCLQSRERVGMLRGPVNTGPVPGRNGREARARRRKSEGTSGTDGKTRKTDRSGIRCGERAERDHPREAREPEADTEAEHLGQPWGEESEEVGRNGPEEIRAATQRRLLGAFCCSGPLRESTPRVDMTVTPGRYGAEVDALLEGLDSTQRDAVTSRAAPLAILAGAGSGKTRVLTRRIAWQSSEGLIDPEHTLAVTFTRKAAGELRARLARLGVRESVTAGTFHAIALAQLRRRADEQGRTMPELLDRKVRILMRLLPNRGPRGRAGGGRDRVRDRMGQGPAGEARRLRGRGHPRRAGHAASAGRGGGDLRVVRAGEAQAGPGRLRRPHHRLRRRARARRRLRRRATMAVPSPLRRRVPGRQRRAVPSAAGVARRPQRPVRGRRSRPGDLRVRRRRRVVPRRVPPRVPGRALPRGRHRAAREQLPVDAPGGGGRERGARTARTSSPRGARRPARRSPPHVHRVRHRRRRSARRRPRAARRRERAAPLVAHGRALPRQRAVGPLRGGDDARRHPLPRARRRAVPRTPGGAGRARRAARRRP